MLQIIEDNAGGLWLHGRIHNNAQVYYGDLGTSRDGMGCTELVSAFWDGIIGWEHEQNNTHAINEEPLGVVVASYDGDDLTLCTHKMGNAARRYFGLRDALSSRPNQLEEASREM